MLSINLGALTRLFDKKFKDPLFLPVVSELSQIASLFDRAAANRIRVIVQAKGEKPQTGHFVVHTASAGFAVQFDHNPFLEEQIRVELILLMETRKVTGCATIAEVHRAEERIVLDYPSRLDIEDQPRTNYRVSPEETDTSFNAFRSTNLQIPGSIFVDISTTGCAFFVPRGVDLRGTAPRVVFSYKGSRFNLQGVVKRWVPRPDLNGVTLCGIQFMDTKDNKRQLPALDELVRQELD
ncbi:MAG: hypothetical protein HQL87_08770 [Magnetococcales bacterium]|nr:hypothetical protein [Magnetococcales bacterium]